MSQVRATLSTVVDEVMPVWLDTVDLVNHTPIYDELRERRLTEHKTDVSSATQATIRLPACAYEPQDNIDVLAGRRGLGGRHRRTSS